MHPSLLLFTSALLDELLSPPPLSLPPLCCLDGARTGTHMYTCTHAAWRSQPPADPNKATSAAPGPAATAAAAGGEGGPTPPGGGRSSGGLGPLHLMADSPLQQEARLGVVKARHAERGRPALGPAHHMHPAAPWLKGSCQWLGTSDCFFQYHFIEPLYICATVRTCMWLSAVSLSGGIGCSWLAGSEGRRRRLA